MVFHFKFLVDSQSSVEERIATPITTSVAEGVEDIKNTKEGEETKTTAETTTAAAAVSEENWKPVRPKKSKVGRVGGDAAAAAGGTGPAKSNEESKGPRGSSRRNAKGGPKKADVGGMFAMDEDFDDEDDEVPEVSLGGRRKAFTDYDADGELDDDYEISDHDLSKIIIVTQTSSGSGKSGKNGQVYDRTGDWTTRVKLTQEIAQIINDGLYQYEQDLWLADIGHAGHQHHAHFDVGPAGVALKQHKTVDIISQEDFDLYSSSPKKATGDLAGLYGSLQAPPPPPPPTYVDEEDAAQLMAKLDPKRKFFGHCSYQTEILPTFLSV